MKPYNKLIESIFLNPEKFPVKGIINQVLKSIFQANDLILRGIQIVAGRLNIILK